MIGVIPFIVNNARWLLPLVGALILFIAAWWYISSVKKEAYQKGVSDERTRYEQIIAEENIRNRKFEDMLNTAIAEYGRRAVEEASKRVKKETVHTRSIETIIKDNPTVYTECKADEAVIVDRNAIRSLGPTK